MSAGWVAALALAGLILAGGGSRQRLAEVLGTSRAASAATMRPTRLRRAADPFDAAISVPYDLALELQAGRDLGSAFLAASGGLETAPELAGRLRRAAEAARAGRDVGPVLCGGNIDQPDSTGAPLQVTAVCCAAASRAGLPLSDLLDAAAQAARDAAALRGLARAELATARSTGLLLAALPLAGIAMGELIGARPLAVLLGTPWGAGCLLAAAGLTGAGVLWSRAITARLARVLP